ncbi:MAG: hypothetical protein AABX70_00050 [Nanoarchaeota archaeon]
MEPKTAERLAAAVLISATLGGAALTYHQYQARASASGAGEPSGLEAAVGPVTYHVYDAHKDRTIFGYHITNEQEERDGGTLYAILGNQLGEVKAEWLVLPNGEMRYIDNEPLPGHRGDKIPPIPDNAVIIPD